MNTIPSFEAILLEIQQSFGLKTPQTSQTSQKQRFVNLESSSAKHRDMASDILTQLFDVLDHGHDPALLDDLLFSAMVVFQFHSAVENNVRTYGADTRQVMWHLLGHQFAAGLARTYGFWSSAAPVAPGMAGGDLWFVPRPDPSDPSRLRLPVQTVAEWWLDLLGGTLDQIWDSEDGIWDSDDGARRVRNLHNWRTGTLPSRSAIDEAFRSSEFNYRGTFADRPNEPLETRFRDALAFVTERKELDAAALAREIPSVPAAVFEAALTGSADDGDKEAFVAAVAERWQEPSTATVRRRFLLARVVQDGHDRLTKLISPPVASTVADPVANKMVQIWTLFEETYRLTLEADRGCRSEAEAKARFAALVPEWLADGPLKSIMDVRLGAPEAFARWLSDRFRDVGAEADLADLFEGGDLHAGPANRPVDTAATSERKDLEALLNRVRHAMEEGQQTDAEDILRQVEAHPRSDEFAADVLFLHGRHRLNVNDVEGAKELFEEAFTQCRLGGFGTTRKIVAYACLGMAMAFGCFDKKAERYFRVIATSLDPSVLRRNPHLEYEGDHGMDVLFRDVSVEAAEQFWVSLYRPYPGVERMAPPAEADYRALLEGFIAPFIRGDKQALGVWAKKNRKLLNTRLKDVRGDTFFGALLKRANHVDKTFQPFPAIGMEATEFAGRVREGLHTLAGMLGSKALDTADFKGQTLLMLAADQGDARLVEILLERGVERDAQDVKGRTALHSAAASRSTDCYLLILEKGADPTVKTVDELSALHSAVKFGLPDAVSATLEKWPSRFTAEAVAELLEMARHIQANYKTWRTQMAKAGRKMGPKPAYKMIAETLEQHLRGDHRQAG